MIEGAYAKGACVGPSFTCDRPDEAIVSMSLSTMAA